MPEREVLEHRDDKRYVRRDDRGRFTGDQVAVGESLTSDRPREAKTEAKRGHGDQGDRRD